MTQNQKPSTDGRKCEDFINSYLAYVQNTEPPKSYHVWTAISTIAGAMQRRYYMNWGTDTIYPNQYIILVGPSGRCRKGTAINIGKKILSTLSDVSIATEDVTREALISTMTESGVTCPGPDGTMQNHSPITIMSDELSVFLGQADIKFLANLTDWYDSKDFWAYRTQRRGVERIHGVCINLLGATAPDWLSSMLPTEAIGGGFTSRAIFVVETNKAKIVPRPIITPEQEKIYENLLHDIEKIHSLYGEMFFSKEAEECYVRFYEEQEKNTMQGSPPISDPTFGGYCDRRATHIKKLAMVLSMARSDNPEITEYDFLRALSLLKSTERRMPEVFRNVGENSNLRGMNTAINYIRKQKEAPLAEIYKLLSKDSNSTSTDDIINALEKQKIARVRYDGSEKEGLITYIGDPEKEEQALSIDRKFFSE